MFISHVFCVKVPFVVGNRRDFVLCDKKMLKPTLSLWFKVLT